MLLKCLLFIFILGEISAQFDRMSRTCKYPRLDHGRFRMRQRSKLIKFICFPSYTLVGNKYATCRDGEWDVPIPICVRPGCAYPDIKNGIAMTSHAGAWAVFFCYPRHRLIGSPAVYCDGRRWNATVPSCIDTTLPTDLTCNFEEPSICGWSQDELHDFDWKRLNKKTPSSFLFTGPSFDHTYGEKGNGYYMYIESTARQENETARLISPIYDSAVAKNGCFSFYYHMFGRTTGGLRVYQKPENMALQTMLFYSDLTKYLLFELWGNQGNEWFHGVAMLKNVSDDFQIVIEGIRGSSFTSDIAVDDVAILQGENCTSVGNTVTMPTGIVPDSCAGRCSLLADAETDLSCGCTALCVGDGNCCPDFFDYCAFTDTSSTEENSPADQPQTQKLVLTTTPSPTIIPSSPKNVTPPPTVTPTRPSPTKTPVTPTPRPTTPKLITSTRRIITSTVKKDVPTPKIVTPTVKIVTVTKKTSTLTVTNTPVRSKTPIFVIEPDKPEDETTVVVVKTTPFSVDKNELEDHMKFQKEQLIQAHRLSKEQDSGKSSKVKSTVLSITSILLCVAIVYALVWSRGARGREALARLRGRRRHDADVRYLHADVDDD